MEAQARMEQERKEIQARIEAEQAERELKIKAYQEEQERMRFERESQIETMRIEREKQLEAFRVDQEAAKAEYLKKVEAEKLEREVRMAEYQKELEGQRLEREAKMASYKAEQDVRYAQMKLDSEKREADLRASAATYHTSAYRPVYGYPAPYHPYQPMPYPDPWASPSPGYYRGSGSPMRYSSPTRDSAMNESLAKPQYAEAPAMDKKQR